MKTIIKSGWLFLRAVTQGTGGVEAKRATLAWVMAYAAWEKAAAQWREEFLLVARDFTRKTGRGLNIGLIYTGQLEGGAYGSGLPLFWSKDYFQPAGEGEVAGELAVTKGDVTHVHSIEQLNLETAVLLRVRPAQYVDSLVAAKG